MTREEESCSVNRWKFPAPRGARRCKKECEAVIIRTEKEQNTAWLCEVQKRSGVMNNREGKIWPRNGGTLSETPNIAYMLSIMSYTGWAPGLINYNFGRLTKDQWCLKIQLSDRPNDTFQIASTPISIRANQRVSVAQIGNCYFSIALRARFLENICVFSL